MKKLLLTLLLPIYVFSQNDLLSEIDTIKADTKVESAFKSLKIVNLESTKLVGKGDFYLVIAHRFDYINHGFDDFFGIDNANTQIKFVYGFKDCLSVHIARSGFEEIIDAGIKYRLINQEKDGFPLTIVGFNSIAVNAEMKKENYPKLEFKNRLSYVTQILISRKFTDKLSLEIAPTYFHENTLKDIVDENNNTISPNPQNNNQFAIGMGGRYKFAKRWSFNIDYAAHLNRASQSTCKNPLSIGVDLETGGHVFQMHFTNSRAMHEAGYLGKTSGSWSKSEIAFGFNLVRVF